MWSLFFNKKFKRKEREDEDLSEAKKAVVFCFDGTNYGPNVRKELENIGFSILMYYEKATPEIITAAIEQLHPVDELEVCLVVVYHKKIGKEIAPFKKECKGKKVAFVSINSST